ncbi:hypothetical protein [Paenibacillus thiaminolyticus]|nr:hypothetical protein [Paenibacillus thiaminolyticus]
MARGLLMKGEKEFAVTASGVLSVIAVLIGASAAIILRARWAMPCWSDG